MKSALGKSYSMEPYYQYLVKEGYFDTMKDVMLLAIVIGFKNNSRIAINKYGGDPIKEHIFKDDMDFLNVIAVLTTKDINILLDDNKEEKYKMLEEYAESGMNTIVKDVFNGQYTDADRIIEYVKQFEPKVSTQKKDLSSYFGEIIKDLDS